MLGVRRRSSSASSPARDSVDAEFTAFMTTHGPALLRTAWLLCGDGHRAEELTQQALVRTYAAWPRARRDPLAYARRILVNLRVDTWRRRRREVLTSPDEMPDTAGTVRVGASVSDDHARTEDRDQLVRALALLSPRQRRIVVLRHLVDLPEAEVAAVLGVSVGTVKSTSSRGLATLREALTDDREGDAR
ncbi:RNA polymerase sigma-70 factor (sigma-E family) [Cellulomonas sp. PhB150]|nr:RNA polymerase sigma-70 factor (sigma-E family) [Cellulomonas sp. PhB150]